MHMDVRYLTLTLLLASSIFGAEPRRDEQVQQAFAGLEPVSEEPTLAPVRESDVLLEPPAPGELGVSGGLGVPSWLAGESTGALPVEVEAAFELDRNPAPPTAKSVLGKSPAPAPPLAASIARIERLARDAKTMGGLNDLLDECVGASELKLTAVETKRIKLVEAWALDRRGELKCAAGDEHGGFNDFQAAIACDENCWSARQNRGVTLAQYGRNDEALTDFDAALELKPDFITARRNRGELLLRTGEAAKALADFTIAQKESPQDADLCSLAGEALQQLGRTAEAEAMFTRSLKLNAEQPEVLSLRAMTHAAQGNYKQALIDFDAALKLDPECGMAYRDVAWLLSTCPDPKFRSTTKAREAARRAKIFCPPGDLRVQEVLASLGEDPQVQPASLTQE
jgi:tetratricopeptide (TPR) repeat protein